MLVRLLLCMGLTLSFGHSSAASLQQLAQLENGLGEHVSLLEDAADTLRIEQLLSGTRAGDFRRSNQSIVNLGFSAPIHWFRIELQVSPQDLEQTWFAEIDYPVLDLVDLYLAYEGQLIHQQRGGDQVPVSQRTMVARTLSFNLPFEKTGDYQLYLRMQTQSSHTLPLRILDSQRYFERNNQYQIWFGMYYGVILITILFSALVALLLRSGMFLDYSAFVLFAGLSLPLSLTGHGNLYIWGESPWLSNAITPMTMGLALFFALALTRKTLETAELSPRVDRMFRIEQALCLLVAVIPLLASYSLAIRLGTVMGGACALSVLLASIYTASHKRRTALLFLFAWSWYLVAVLVKVMSVFGVLAYTTLTSYSMQIGLSILIIALAAALGELLHSERRQLLEAQLQSLRDSNERRQAELASQTRTEFLARMSHELRTPMNAVLGFSELGMRRDNEERRGEFLSQIHSAASNLLALINEILDFSKIEAGRLNLEQEPTDLPRLLDKLRGMFQLQADKKDIGLVIDCASSVPPCILTDPLRLEQVLTNLLSNAIKFTESGGVEVLVEALEIDNERRLQVNVRDTGVGIDMQDSEQLFEAFKQADDSITRRYGGTGLGLVISKQLIKLMGGEIGVESQPGLGSDFWFWIPLTESDLPAQETAAQRTSLPALADTKAAARLQGKKILLAEDNLLNQKLIQSLLSGLQVELVTVENGRQALEAAKQHQFDLVLMDIFMPEMDGYSATRAIREIPELKQLPIIAVSASVADHDRQSCFDAGMNDFVAKPVRSEELFASMLRQLGHTVASKPASETQTASTPELSVLDTQQGLSYCDQNPKLYRELLEDFHQRYRDATLQISRAINSNRREDGRRIAHTLKGLAASLGLQQLHHSATNVEHRLKQDGELPELDELSNDLQAAHKAITAHLAETQTAAKD